MYIAESDQHFERIQIFQRGSFARALLSQNEEKITKDDGATAYQVEQVMVDGLTWSDSLESELEENFDSYFSNYEEPTTEERIEELEAAILELAELIGG